MKNTRSIHGTHGVQTLVLFSFFKFCLQMPSASSPALSRVVSPKRTHVLLLEGRVGELGGWVGWGVGALGVTG